MRLLIVVGTRPEAIKMAPLILALRREPTVETLVCATGQHREMLDQVLSPFGIEPELDLRLMEPDQGLNALAGQAIVRLDEAYAAIAPDRVLVHGDTTTAMAAALAAFHRQIPIGHVEAGLRSHALDRPWPEEMNRRTIDIVSDLLFAPTSRARRNLEAEALEGRIVVTGNTGIDSLEIAARRLEADGGMRAWADAQLPRLEPGRKLLLVTGHRRESFGEGLRSICDALARLALRSDLDIVYPVHLNPHVLGPVKAALSGRPNVHLVAPIGFLPFVRLMQRADLILTDSGGIQEEAPTLGKPVLVMRDVTERPEAVESAKARLVGTDAARIVRESEGLLDSEAARAAFAATANPYGDGRASERIVDALLGRPLVEFGEAPAATADIPRYG